MPWDVLMAAMRRIKTECPSMTTKEVMETIIAQGDTDELAAVKKMRSKLTNSWYLIRPVSGKPAISRGVVAANNVMTSSVQP